MKRRITTTIITLSLLLGLALWSAGRGAQAKAGLATPATPMATLTVTNTDDSGPGSLRQAIADAATNDTINFAVTGTITLTSGELLIQFKNLTIQGPGAKLLAISGNNTSRIFNLGSATFNLSGLTITDGNGQGAAFNNGFGGGILMNSGTLHIDACAIVNNQTSAGNATGGGMNVSFSTFTMTNSTISGNSGAFGGGLNTIDSQVALSNSTISGNTSSFGAGIFSRGHFSAAAITLTNCTIAGNNGVGLRLQNLGAFATAQLKNTLAANNAPNFVKVGDVALTSLGHNLDSHGTSGFANGANGDLVGSSGSPIDARLAPLADYGGQTQTQALLNGSPAIDAGDNTGAPATDQRGVTRTGTVDIGAFEAAITLNPAALPAGTAGASYPAQSFSANGGTAPYSFALAGALPAGMSFSGGTLSGTPTQTGSFNLTVTATDSLGLKAVSQYALQINCQTITVNPTASALPNGTVGVSYSQDFTQSGGIGAVSFSKTGALPAGLTLTPGGVLGGTPTAAGNFNFSIIATDSNGCAGSRAYSLTIVCPAITATVSGGGMICPGASATVTVNLNGGTAPYTVTLTNGGGTQTGGSSSFNFNVSPAATTTYTVASATDAFGCPASSSGSATVTPDNIAPAIAAGAKKADNMPYLAGTWTNQTVTVHFTCSDNCSLAFCPADVVLAGSGVTPLVSGTATDGAGNTASTGFGPVQIDKMAPTVSVAGVANGATYPLGAAPAAACNTTDPHSGVASAAALTVTGGNAQGVGTFTAACGSATDNVGNASAPVSVSYTVAYNLNKFVALAQEGVELDQRTSVVSGDVGARIHANGPFLGDGVEVSIGQQVEMLSPASHLLGDSISIKQRATVYNPSYNDLDNNGTVLGTAATPLNLSLIPALPALPSITPGTQNFEVAQQGTLTINAGSYGDLVVRQRATITFTGGVYHFRSWDVGQQVNLHFLAPSEIRIAGKLAVDQRGYVGPAPSATSLTARDIVLYVAGQNGNSGTLGANPKAAVFGQEVTLKANVVVPNGTLLLRQRTEATGAFFGKWVQIGQQVRLALESRFGL